MSHHSPLISSDIDAYLTQHENKELLRFITCGNVDDGKSTLIGRLLHDSKMIFEDQLSAIAHDSKTVGSNGGELDLALLVDGLQSEREQGITIDVAYRFFSTEKRKFIIADTPGHEQYTRNMATGASTADLAIILIDSRQGVQTQTRRHSFIVKLLGIHHVIVAVNKMDIVNYSQIRFNDIKADYLQFAEELGLDNIHFIPLSALKGDNVVETSAYMPWYKGKTLMQLLNTIPLRPTNSNTGFNLPVQLINRPSPDFRGYAGSIASGTIRVGDKVVVLPSKKSSRVKSIVTYDGDLDEACQGMAVTLTLTDEIDIGRGDVISKIDTAETDNSNLPTIATELDVNIVWMNEDPLTTGKNYFIKRGSSMSLGNFERIYSKTDVNSFAQQAAKQLELNEIGYAKLSLTSPLVFDSYNENRQMGSFIVIDRISNSTVGAGMIIKASETEKTPEKSDYSAFEIEFNALVRKHFPHWQAKVIR